MIDYNEATDTYTCNECGFTSRSQYGMRSHVAKMHKKRKPAPPPKLVVWQRNVERMFSLLDSIDWFGEASDGDKYLSELRRDYEELREEQHKLDIKLRPHEEAH